MPAPDFLRPGHLRPALLELTDTAALPSLPTRALQAASSPLLDTPLRCWLKACDSVCFLSVLMATTQVRPDYSAKGWIMGFSSASRTNLLLRRAAMWPWTPLPGEHACVSLAPSKPLGCSPPPPGVHCGPPPSHLPPTSPIHQKNPSPTATGQALAPGASHYPPLL